jgi:hypothetical protein
MRERDCGVWYKVFNTNWACNVGPQYRLDSQPQEILYYVLLYLIVFIPHFLRVATDILD